MPQIRGEHVRSKEAKEKGIWLTRKDAPPTQTSIDRIIQVANLISKGKSDATILKMIKDEWGITEENNRRLYLNAAYRYLTPKDWGEEREKIYTRNIQSLQKIIEKCTDKDNHRAAIEAINTLNKMIGVGTNTNTITFKKDEDNNDTIEIKFGE